MTWPFKRKGRKQKEVYAVCVYCTRSTHFIKTAALQRYDGFKRLLREYWLEQEKLNNKRNGLSVSRLKFSEFIQFFSIYFAWHSRICIVPFQFSSPDSKQRWLKC